MLGTAPASASRVPAKYRLEPTFDRIWVVSIKIRLLVAGVVDQSEVNMSLNPFCANTPALFVRTNDGLPVRVNEFAVRLSLGAFAVAHKGVSAFA